MKNQLNLFPKLTQAIVISVVVMICFFISCSKDETIPSESQNNLNDTLWTCDLTTYVTPGDYFPAHPGSWWTYENELEEETTYEIDSMPKEYHEQCLPYFINLECHLSENSFRHEVTLCGSGTEIANSGIVPIELNVPTYATFSLSKMRLDAVLCGPPDYTRELLVVDTIISDKYGVIYHNVNIVRDIREIPNWLSHEYLEYFAHGIGLIKRDSISSIDTTEVLTLNSYFINE